MAEKNTEKKTSHNGRNTMIAAIVLVILLLLSFAMIASFLLSKSADDRNIIPVFYEGDREIFEDGGLSYIRAEETPQLTTYDEVAQWEVSTSVDLFKTAYENAAGETTVQSGNGEKVIAPGTENSYEFSLKNTGNISLDYSMRLDSVFTLQNQQLPIKVRLHSGDRWIVGNEAKWVSPDELKGIVEQGTIAVNKITTYVFEWQWPYEDGIDDALLLNDLNDTIVANTAVSQEVVFTLNIETESMISEGAVPTSSGGVELRQPLTLWNTMKYGTILGVLLLGIGLILLFICRKPLYVAGFLADGAGKKLSIGCKSDMVRVDGRFAFRRIYMGTHKLHAENGEHRKVKFSRSLRNRSIVFADKNGVLKLSVGRRVDAIEIYLRASGEVVVIDRRKWAAIDRKRNVLLPDKIVPAVDKANVTPGGLSVDKNGRIDIK